MIKLWMLGVSLVGACVVFATQEMPISSPEAQGVSSQAILQWLETVEKNQDGVHGFVFARHGHVIAEGSWAPFHTLTEPHMLYSHSKSITSTAIGFLVDEGKLDLDDRVVDLFPESLPSQPSENLRQMRVRDLLTMNMGAPVDHLLKNDQGDWARRVLAKEFKFAPGTRFRYDSDATYLLACLVEKKAKQPMMDFLNTRLFKPLGMGSLYSYVSPQGVPCGGWGMRMNTRDLAKFGQFLLQEGRWGTEQLLSRDWVRLATAKHTKTSGSHDWCQGYCFQFWRNELDGYRADGAFGQFTLVLPKYDAVISLHSGSVTTQKELDHVWNLVKTFSPKPLPANEEALKKLRSTCAFLKFPLMPGARQSKQIQLPATTTFQFPHLPGYTKATLLETESGWNLIVSGPSGERTIPVGYQTWAKSLFHYSDSKVEPLFHLVDKEPMACSGGWTAPSRFNIRIFLTGAPQHGDLVLNFK